MHKSSAEDFLSCGIDVSAAQLSVTLETPGGLHQQRLLKLSDKNVRPARRG
jgi:hypothetical protein